MPDYHPPLPVGMEQKTQFEDYTVEVRNRFKGLDLIECLMNYGWSFMTLYRHKDQGHPQEKEMQKSKMAV